MICTLTARRLRAGLEDEFCAAFELWIGGMPEEVIKRWSRVFVCRRRPRPERPADVRPLRRHNRRAPRVAGALRPRGAARRDRSGGQGGAARRLVRGAEGDRAVEPAGPDPAASESCCGRSPRTMWPRSGRSPPRPRRAPGVPPRADVRSATTALAIVEDGRVVGLVEYRAEEEPDYRHAWIDVFVDPARHGHALGTDAVRTLARHVIDARGPPRVTDDPAVGHAAAVRSYEKVGSARSARCAAPRATRTASGATCC